MTQRVAIVTALGGAILATAIGVVDAKHDTRMLFHKLQNARAERARLHARWSQLKLEHATWASPERVSRIAQRSLDMRSPKQAAVVRVDP